MLGLLLVACNPITSNAQRIDVGSGSTGAYTPRSGKVNPGARYRTGTGLLVLKMQGAGLFGVGPGTSGAVASVGRKGDGWIYLLSQNRGGLRVVTRQFLSKLSRVGVKTSNGVAWISSQVWLETDPKTETDILLVSDSHSPKGVRYCAYKDYGARCDDGYDDPATTIWVKAGEAMVWSYDQGAVKVDLLTVTRVIDDETIEARLFRNVRVSVDEQILPGRNGLVQLRKGQQYKICLPLERPDQCALGEVVEGGDGF